MAKKKVAILGGGIAALTTAYELSRGRLRDEYEVTVYQMGWRLGGKLASGRAGPHERNLEHGLHVWFGCYENAFRMLRDVYESLEQRGGFDPRNPIRTVSDALKPRSYTPVGLAYEGERSYYPLLWPEDDEVPGEGGVLPSPWSAITKFLSLIEDALLHPVEGFGAGEDAARVDVPDRIACLFNQAMSAWGGGRRDHPAAGLRISEGRPSSHDHASVFHKIVRWFESFEGDPLRHAATHHDALRWLLIEFRELYRREAARHRDPNGHVSLFAQAVDLGATIVIGMLDPKYGVIEHMDLNRINPFEFSRWLVDCGASPEVVWKSTLPTVLYNTMFAYDEGDPEKRDMEAGTAVRILLRIVATYKGALFYFVQGGMGEIVIAPLYELLRDRGVKFEFFHKVKKLELSPDEKLVARIHLEQQAQVKSPPYRAVRELVDHVPCWPAEPFWDELVDGDKLQAARVDFESHWCPWPRGLAGPKPLVLELGRHFDQVVLGISLGAFKKLNDDPGMCDELIEASSAFADTVEHLGLAPSMAAQVWLTKDISGLGFDYERRGLEGTLPAMVCGAMPLDIWADMTQVLDLERWSGPGKARSVHYFCGTYDTKLYKAPSRDGGVPARAHAEIREKSASWFESNAGTIWPDAAPGGALDWSVFVDDESREGPARFDAQFWRANIDPTECCVTSPTDTTRYRLRADESGFLNLFVSGAWTRTGLNATCVEAAVMSGMAASRAICGSPRTIAGEDFFQADDRETRRVAGKPPYVSRLGQGQESMQPPGLMRGAKVYTFFLRSDHARLQSFIDAQLNRPQGSSPRWEYRVLGDHVAVSFMNADSMTSASQEVGYLHDCECTFWVFLAVYEPGRWLPDRIVFYNPYVIVDTGIAMATGREIWGWHKEMGRIETPEKTGDPARFACQATLFETFSPKTEGRLATLIEVTGARPWEQPASLWQDAPGALHGIRSALERGPTTSIVRDALGELLSFSPLAHFLEPRVPMVNFKQFRDAADATRACYQAIIESPARVQRLRGGGLLTGPFEIAITRCESHQIVEQLGLEGYRVGTDLGIWVDMDFLAEAGHEVWVAGS